MITLNSYIQQENTNLIYKELYVITNCLVFKKHKDIIKNDLLYSINQQKSYIIEETVNIIKYSSSIVDKQPFNNIYIDGFDRFFGREWK